MILSMTSLKLLALISAQRDARCGVRGMRIASVVAARRISAGLCVPVLTGGVARLLLRQLPAIPGGKNHTIGSDGRGSSLFVHSVPVPSDSICLSRSAFFLRRQIVPHLAKIAAMICMKDLRTPDHT